jgi:hypothetical protein
MKTQEIFTHTNPTPAIMLLYMFTIQPASGYEYKMSVNVERIFEYDLKDISADKHSIAFLDAYFGYINIGEAVTLRTS